MEQIYTIPVNEAFEASRDDASCGCPFCTLYNKLEQDELELILGASMMEPDVRIQTNKEGFCRTHYDMMFVRKNRLGMALTLESHLNELKNEIKEGGFLSAPTQKPVKRIEALERSCYVCRRIDFNFAHMIETAVLLWESDPDFRQKLSAQPYFCLPHYRRFLSCASERLPKKELKDLASAVSPIVENYLDKLSGDVSWFCKKFDYRYDAEPWYDSKDAVERAIRFLRSDLHRPPEKKK
ncbi:MAG: hypothetical protein E7668_02610 [Ruminococcaceae bacterium]|nr:hypothetical protein [Oscillospiraceae bacterium]